MARKKLTVLLLALTLIYTSSMAEWAEVEIREENFQIYVDTSSIEALGSGRVRMWDLKDYGVMQEFSGVRYASEKSLREYDCQESRLRRNALKWFYGNMGEGEVVVSYLNNGLPEDWVSTKPDDELYLLLKIACADLEVEESMR